MDLSVELKGVKFKTCIMNGSGPKCGTLEELKQLGESESSAIVMKSATIEPREGNPEPRYFSDKKTFSINSMGLPNLGYEKYCEFIPELKKYGKPVVACVAGFSVDEYKKMVIAFSDADADIIEVNLSCPNVIGKPQAGYNFEYSEQVLSEVRMLTEKPIAVKLPPYFDLSHTQTMAGILKKTKIDVICAVNSVGNTLGIDAEKEQPVIKPKGGFGGLGGA
ncbi:dihydroorotate oxidase, partial [Candidatus Micrarchaeota archaeon]|nr:dihydroorotate oxidase [Candidatus Micrarchaeota archaeon]